MFHLHFADLVQLRLPFSVLRQVVRCARGEKDVSRVAAIHHTLRDVDAGAREVRFVVHV